MSGQCIEKCRQKYIIDFIYKLFTCSFAEVTNDNNIREKYPFLSNKAIEILKNHFTYEWK
jgi:hypothetical protein